MTFGRALLKGAADVVDGARNRMVFRRATRVGREVCVFGWVHVENEGELVVGRGAAFVSRPAGIALLVRRGASLVIGDRALIESGAILRARGRIDVGPAARIGAGCVLDDDGAEDRDVSIGAGAWIDDGVVLVGGARVGPGSWVRRAAGGAPADDRSPSGAASERSEDQAALQVEKRVRAVLARIVAGAAQVEQDTAFAEVTGWDSLAALRVLVALEKEFAVMLPHQLLVDRASLASVTPAIAARVAARRGEAGT